MLAKIKSKLREWRIKLAIKKLRSRLAWGNEIDRLYEKQMRKRNAT